MNKKYGLYFYFFILHTVIIYCIVGGELLKSIFKDINSSSEWGYTQQVTHAFNLRVDKNTSKERIVFIGDSHVQGLAVNEVTNRGVNFGIGRDTSKTILNRVYQYQSPKSAKAVVLAFGINDFQYRSVEEALKNYKAVLDAIPETTLIVINAVFNIDTLYVSKNININNKDIQIFNQKLERLSKDYSNSIFLSINSKLSEGNQLRDSYHIGDGLHLNKNGYQIWINALKELLNKEVK